MLYWYLSWGAEKNHDKPQSHQPVPRSIFNPRAALIPTTLPQCSGSFACWDLPCACWRCLTVNSSAQCPHCTTVPIYVFPCQASEMLQCFHYTSLSVAIHSNTLLLHPPPPQSPVYATSFPTRSFAHSSSVGFLRPRFSSTHVRCHCSDFATGCNAVVSGFNSPLGQSFYSSSRPSQLWGPLALSPVSRVSKLNMRGTELHTLPHVFMIMCFTGHMVNQKSHDYIHESPSTHYTFSNLKSVRIFPSYFSRIHFSISFCAHLCLAIPLQLFGLKFYT